MRALRFLAVLASMLFLALPALAEGAAEITITDPTGGLLAAIPGGIYIYAILVAIAGLVSVFVKDTTLPPLVAKAINFLALNVGKAKNDPAANAPKTDAKP